ncbi:MAG: GtrA family protein [bacterium]
MFRSFFSFQFIKFCITGGLGVVTDHGIFTLITTVWGVSRETCPGIMTVVPVAGYFAAVIQNYIINHHWTFSLKTSGTSVSTSGFLRFTAVSLLSLIPRMLIYNSILFLIPMKTELLPHIANLCGIAAGTAVNFIGVKYFVFKSSSKNQPEDKINKSQ